MKKPKGRHKWSTIKTIKRVILMGKDHSKSVGHAAEQKAKKEAEEKAKKQIQHNIGRKGKN